MGNFDAHGVGKNTPRGNCPFEGQGVGILPRDALDKCVARMCASLDVVCNSIARAHAWLWEMGKWAFLGGCGTFITCGMFYSSMESVWLDVDLLWNVSLRTFKHFFPRYDLPKTCMFLHVRWIWSLCPEVRCMRMAGWAMWWLSFHGTLVPSSSDHHKGRCGKWGCLNTCHLPVNLWNERELTHVFGRACHDACAPWFSMEKDGEFHGKYMLKLSTFSYPWRVWKTRKSVICIISMSLCY